MSNLTLLNQARALRHRANRQLDQRVAKRLHKDATEAWRDWLALAIADGLPRYDHHGRRVHDPDPPAKLNITIPPMGGKQEELWT